MKLKVGTIIPGSIKRRSDACQPKKGSNNKESRTSIDAMDTEFPLTNEPCQ